MANRKPSSRSRRKANKPAVIDATAVEVNAADNDPAADAEDNVSSAAESSTSNEAAAHDTSSDDASTDVKPESSDNSRAGEADERSDAEPVEAEPETATATGKTSSGKGKWIAAGLAAILLSGVAGGGYLYRTYGEQIFGSASTDQGLAALESQVMDATGTAQAAREAAESATGKLDGLNQRMDGLEKAVQDAAAAGAAPDPALSDAISKAQETAAAAVASTEQLSGKTAGLEKNLAEVQGSVGSLQKALDEAAKSGGGTDQAAINLRLEELAKKVEAVAASASGTSSPDPAELEALKQQLASNQQTMADLASQVETLTAKLAAATARLDEAAETSQATTPNLADLGKDVDALTNAVNAGTPFQAELDRLKEQVALPALPALNANASSGIMTVAALEQRLGEIGSALKGQTPATVNEPDGIWGMVQSKISSVVKIRSLDEPDWSGVVTQAQQALVSGGLDSAVATLQDKSASMPSELANWLVEARKRTAAQAELKGLPQALMSAAPAAGQSQ